MGQNVETYWNPVPPERTTFESRLPIQLRSRDGFNWSVDHLGLAVGELSRDWIDMDRWIDGYR